MTIAPRIGPASWLPPGKTAALCFSVDDVHPGTGRDAYEAGGDLQDGALGRLMRLQARHEQLKLTLCVTPDWRLNSLIPDTSLWRRVPLVKNHLHWTRRHPAGHFRLDRHPKFAAFLNGQERCELVLHGLHHAAPGPRVAVEFQDQSVEECVAALERGLEIFDSAGLRHAGGFVPPAWNAPPNLLAALARLNFRFLCSARDLTTEVAPTALANHCGLAGVSLLYPQFLTDSALIHMTCNFQATSTLDRALAILEMGGLLHIKAHIFKTGGGHTMLDGLDDLYANYLDALLRIVNERFGNALWWAHLSEVAARLEA